jgi:Zn-dependent protease with chaperone function
MEAAARDSAVGKMGADFTVDAACEANYIGLTDFCSQIENLTLLNSISLWTAAAGVGLLGGIWMIGKLSQNNRLLMVRLFRPGLYATVLLLIALVLTHAGIAISALYFGGLALGFGIPGAIIFPIAFGAAVGVIAMSRNAFAIVRKAQVAVIGMVVDRNAEPKLWAEIESAAQKLDALAPDHIIVGLEPNFFVTEANVTSLNGELSGRTLYCSLPLCRILTTPEFLSIVGHELAHFKGQDTQFSERFYPIYRGTYSALFSLDAAAVGGAGTLALMPAYATLSYFLESFSVAENKIGREREFVADSVGAGMTSPKVMATALLKLHAFSGIWYGLEEFALATLRDGKMITNASALFADAVVRHAGTIALEEVLQNHQAHPTDTHPSLAERLHSLDQSLADLVDDTLNIAPDDRSLLLFSKSEELEVAVSDSYQLMLSEHAEIALTPNPDEPAPPA